MNRLGIAVKEAKLEPPRYTNTWGHTRDALLATERIEGGAPVLGGRRLVVDGDCRSCDFGPAGAISKGEKSVVAESRGSI